MLIAARNKGNNKSQSFRSPEGVPDGSNGIHLGYRYPIYASCIWTGTKSGQSGTGPSRKPAASNRAATRKALSLFMSDASLGPHPSLAHSSAFTASFVPSDCTLILRPVLRLFAVNHQPVADLLPLFTLKPFSSSRFCVPHMSDASGANSASRLLVESSVFVVATPDRFLSGRMSKAPAEAAAKTLIAVAMVVNLAV